MSKYDFGKYDWAAIIAIGLSIMFVLLGFGGCLYLTEKGAATIQDTQHESR